MSTSRSAPTSCFRRRIARTAVLVGAIVLLSAAQPASASSWGARHLSPGHRGDDVKELQIRVAGWYLNCVAGAACNTHFRLDGTFGPKTERAVKNFQKAYGIPVNGRMDATTFSKLEALEGADGSTPHFDFGEFAEKSGECATANRGTFNGGFVTPYDTGQYVRKLMWRLESIRKKMADEYPVVVWSGFRSRAYQDCLRSIYGRKVAFVSQHSYGTAYDGVMPGINQGRMRGLAKTSQFHGIICYSGSDAHNHLDIRLDNEHRASDGFVWPATDAQGRDLAGDGRVCYGGHSSPPSTGVMQPAVGVGILDPWGLTGDPAGPTAADATAKAATPEEAWMLDDHDDPAESGGICACMNAVWDSAG